jgi:hypothetical protein
VRPPDYTINISIDWRIKCDPLIITLTPFRRVPSKSRSQRFSFPFLIFAGSDAPSFQRFQVVQVLDKRPSFVSIQAQVMGSPDFVSIHIEGEWSFTELEPGNQLVAMSRMLLISDTISLKYSSRVLQCYSIFLKLLVTPI